MPALVHADSSADSTYAARTGLEATTAPPWNPDEPIGRRRAWEQAMLLPGRIVSLPISGLGLLTERSLLYAEQNGWISLSENSINPVGGDARIRPQLHKLGGRAGIGGALELRQPVRMGPTKTILSARYAATFRNYNGTQFSMIGRPLALQYGLEWRPEEHFYGIGNEVPRSSLSNYARQVEYVRLSAFDPWKPGDRSDAASMRAYGRKREIRSCALDVRAASRRSKSSSRRWATKCSTAVSSTWSTAGP
jgi:hypothetical protein